MPILEVQNVTVQNITKVINITTGDPVEIFLNINTLVYEGWYYFILMCVLWLILFKLAQRKVDQPLVNFMYISTLLTVITFILRAMSIVKNGVLYGMITDFQMWIFPLMAVISATINRYLSD